MPMRLRADAGMRQRVGGTLLAALALLLAGCGGPRGAFRATPPTSTASATAAAPADTPVPTPMPVAAGTPLSWAHANLPAGFGMAFHQAALAVQASNGLVAYSCGQVAGDAHLAVITTRDGGASWARVADPPFTADGCTSIAVDQIDPTIVVVNGQPNAVSFDGGASWQLNADAGQELIQQTATYKGRTYAIVYPPQSSGVSSSVAYSDDRMRSWHILFTGAASSDPLRDFWVNPVNGSLLERSYYDMSYSDDGGQHWDPLQYPNPGVTGYAIQQPTTNQPWHVCAMVQGGTLWISCTGDSGRTWQMLAPMPGEEAPNASFWFVGLASDGALLLRDNSVPFTLYRLPAGARQWQALGKAPAQATGDIQFYPSVPEGGALWLFPAESDGAGAPDPATAVYCARYGG